MSQKICAMKAAMNLCLYVCLSDPRISPAEQFVHKLETATNILLVNILLVNMNTSNLVLICNDCHKVQELDTLAKLFLQWKQLRVC